MEIDTRYSNNRTEEDNGPQSEEVRDLMEEYVIAHKSNIPVGQAS